MIEARFTLRSRFRARCRCGRRSTAAGSNDKIARPGSAPTWSDFMVTGLLTGLISVRDILHQLVRESAVRTPPQVYPHDLSAEADRAGREHSHVIADGRRNAAVS